VGRRRTSGANAICPGLIKTGFSAAMWNDNAAVAGSRSASRLPATVHARGRRGLALFLASDAALLYRGVYVVDGG
jgi:NAD(P)-dependent dehydrogenase (short-subunit alcohol dehydrogenase family)